MKSRKLTFLILLGACLLGAAMVASQARAGANEPGSETEQAALSPGNAVWSPEPPADPLCAYLRPVFDFRAEI